MPRLTVLALAAALGATGCTHAMHITNLHEYDAATAPVAPLVPQLKAGVTSRNLADPETRGYVEAIAEGLRRDGSFERVLVPYDPAVHAGAVDVVVDVAVQPRYAGSGTNFLVNWPGFLIFAPAIWGYGYEANVDTQVSLSRAGAPPQTFAIPTRFTFRQAELDRTWTEVGWFEVGIIPLIGGLVFTSYDTDLTPEFVAKVGPTYGTVVARSIRAALAPQAPAPPPQQPPAPPPQPATPPAPPVPSA